MNHIFINRHISQKVLDSSKKMPVITLTGPRQSGKTTLAKYLFKDYKYVNFELPLTRDSFYADPMKFLNDSENGIIIDEFQHIPELLSYIQAVSDADEKPGRFILTGSQNYVMLDRISQSLAGRTSLFKLLPFSIAELEDSKYYESDYRSLLLKGFYPRVYSLDLNPSDWYIDYINLYLERDIRQVLNVKDLAAYSLFLKLCASRAGQILNLTDIAKHVGRDIKTIKSWLSVLELSNIIFFLEPYYQNYNKRITKSPKLYFYDTGVLSSLLNIRNISQYDEHPLKGSLFENLIVSEIAKYNSNNSQLFSMYYWNDRNKKEIDLILEYSDNTQLIEIKSGSGFDIKYSKYFKDFFITYKIKSGKSYVVYNGEDVQAGNDTEYVNWRGIRSILK